eukprot:scaffold96297_cov53-Attheya_sp.AAC.6
MPSHQKDEKRRRPPKSGADTTYLLKKRRSTVAYEREIRRAFSRTMLSEVPRRLESVMYIPHELYGHCWVRAPPPQKTCMPAPYT